MKKKLLACDLDGTLIHRHQAISSQDLQAIKKFREHGHLFSLCTGRTLPWTIPVIETYSLHVDALILCNGSLLYLIDKDHPLGITQLSSEVIPNKIGLQILEYFYNKKNYTIYWDSGTQTFNIVDRTLSKETTIIQENYSKHITITDALKVTSDFVTIGIAPTSADIDEAENTKNYILETWGNYVASYRNQYFVDIAPIQSSKGNGIMLLHKHLNTELELYGIGDSFNDVPMFQTVGKGHAFLMKNGEVTLSEYTDHKVSSVAECIEFLLS